MCEAALTWFSHFSTAQSAQPTEMFKWWFSFVFTTSRIDHFSIQYVQQNKLFGHAILTWQISHEKFENLSLLWNRYRYSHVANCYANNIRKKSNKYFSNIVRSTLWYIVQLISTHDHFIEINSIKVLDPNEWFHFLTTYKLTSGQSNEKRSKAFFNLWCWCQTAVGCFFSMIAITMIAESMWWRRTSDYVNSNRLWTHEFT